MTHTPFRCASGRWYVRTTHADDTRAIQGPFPTLREAWEHVADRHPGHKVPEQVALNVLARDFAATRRAR